MLNAEQNRAEQIAHLSAIAQSGDEGVAMRARMIMGASLAFMDTVNAEIAAGAKGKKDIEVLTNATVILALMAGHIADHLVVRGMSSAEALDVTLRAIGTECGRHLARKMATGYVPELIGQAGPDFDFRTMLRGGEG